VLCCGLAVSIDYESADLMLIEAVVEDQATGRGAFVRKVGVRSGRLRGYALPCTASRELILTVAQAQRNV